METRVFSELNYEVICEGDPVCALTFDWRKVCCRRRGSVIAIMPVHHLYTIVSTLWREYREGKRTKGVIETQLGVPPFKSL